jgi:hypothetical protein
MIKNLFRLEVTYPEGAFDDGFAPSGWAPDAWYVERFGSAEFYWPAARKIYHSRSTARDRARLFEAYGAVVVIRRSAPIVWEYSESEILRERVAELEEMLAAVAS